MSTEEWSIPHTHPFYPPLPAHYRNVRFQFVLLYTVGDRALAAAAEDVTEAVRAGALDIGEEHGMPVHHVPLERAADAHQAVEDATVGKVLIDVSEG